MRVMTANQSPAARLARQNIAHIHAQGVDIIVQARLGIKIALVGRKNKFADDSFAFANWALQEYGIHAGPRMRDPETERTALLYTTYQGKCWGCVKAEFKVICIGSQYRSSSGQTLTYESEQRVQAKRGP
jgi:hypothetical protein